MKKRTSLKINSETIDEQINTHIDRFTRDLSRIYSGFYNMPSKIKLALYDMIFNLGARGLEFTFKNFTMYIKNSDWLSAANESYRRDVNYERNNYVRELLEQTARED